MAPHEAAKALQPRIAEVADEIERERALPPHLVDALYDAGLFTMLLPKSLGGTELDLPTFSRAIQALAEADGSVAWCIGQANGLAAYMAYLAPEVARDLFDGRRMILAGGCAVSPEAPEANLRAAMDAARAARAA